MMFMYGTVARLQPKAEQEASVVELLNEWKRTRGPQISGHVASYLYRSERSPGELLLVAVFQDRKSYEANAEAPEQDRWFQRLRASLEHDPIWEDGEIITAL
jgi:quinol monooxygenase YgiN